MNRLELLINEKIKLLKMSDEEYDQESYTQYLIDTYSFFQIVLDILKLNKDQVDRIIAISILNQSIIINATTTF